ncbi:hypothetical protein PENSPDRAFT_752721 [Peniophora sp. CONT]|nr:hypothetical protein PENSPDRAFT_752721 [Peniophora sp. CONT]
MTISAIQRLPDDLLISLFAALADVYPAVTTTVDSQFEAVPRPSLCWMVVTHVCRRWRAVALEGCSVLWGQSLSAFPSALKTLLPRAKGAPLYFRIDLFPYMTVLHHLPNIGRLEGAFGSADEQGDYWIRALAEKARPRLRRLDLCDHKLRTNPSVIPKPLHRGVALNASTLTHCYLPRVIPMSAPRLRVLHIRAAWISSVREVVHYISAFPLLEDLHLCLPQLKADSTFKAIRHPLKLDFLRSFTNDSGDSSIVALLPYFQVPSTLNLSFSIDFNDDIFLDDLVTENMKAEVLKLSSHLTKSPLGAQARSHDTLIWDLWSPQRRSKRIALSTCKRSQLDRINDQGRKRGMIELNLDGNSLWPVECALHPALTTYLGSQRLTTLYIRFFDVEHDGSYVDNLFELENLFELLADSAFSTVTELIVQLPESRAFFSLFECLRNTHHTSLVLPSLARLVLDSRSNTHQSQTSRSPKVNSDFKTRAYHDRSWVSNLRTMLAHSDDLGHRLRYLVLKGLTDDRMSSSLAVDMNRLKSVVDVVVDRRTRE